MKRLKDLWKNDLVFASVMIIAFVTVVILVSIWIYQM